MRRSELGAFTPQGTGLGQAPGVWNVSDYSMARHKQGQSQKLQVERQKEHKVPPFGSEIPLCLSSPLTGDQLLCLCKGGPVQGPQNPLLSLRISCSSLDSHQGKKLNFALRSTSKAAC